MVSFFFRKKMNLDLQFEIIKHLPFLFTIECRLVNSKWSNYIQSAACWINRTPQLKIRISAMPNIHHFQLGQIEKNWNLEGKNTVQYVHYRKNDGIRPNNIDTLSKLLHYGQYANGCEVFQNYHSNYQSDVFELLKSIEWRFTMFSYFYVNYNINIFPIEDYSDKSLLNTLLQSRLNIIHKYPTLIRCGIIINDVEQLPTIDQHLKLMKRICQFEIPTLTYASNDYLDRKYADDPRCMLEFCKNDNLYLFKFPKK